MVESVKLTDKYPNLLEVCRKHDCDFQEGIRIIEAEKKQGTLRRWIG